MANYLVRRCKKKPHNEFASLSLSIENLAKISHYAKGEHETLCGKQLDEMWYIVMPDPPRHMITCKICKRLFDQLKS